MQVCWYNIIAVLNYFLSSPSTQMTQPVEEEEKFLKSHFINIG